MLFFSSLSPLSGVGVIGGIVGGIGGTGGIVGGIVGVIVGVGVAVVLDVCGRGLRLLRPAVCDL